MATRVRLLTATDLHQKTLLYAELRHAVARHRPDVLVLVGDFLDAFGGRKDQLTASEAAEELASCKVRDVVFVRGNHEDSNWWDFERAWTSTGRPMQSLHGEVAFYGPAAVLGFPCYMGDDTAFTERKSQLPYDPGLWIPKRIKRHGALARTIWLMHEPPSGTVLTAPNSVVAGCDEWTAAVRRFSPLVTMSGHDHQTPIRTGHWFDRLGDTLCVNVGQSDGGPLHFCIVDAKFESAQPTLPSQVSITALPWRRTIDLPASG